jgi:hypothetical protein
LAIRLFHTDKKTDQTFQRKAPALPAKEAIPKIARGRPRSTADAGPDRRTPSSDGSHCGASRGANGAAAERALLTRGHTSTSRQRQCSDEKNDEQSFHLRLLLFSTLTLPACLPSSTLVSRATMTHSKR